MRVIIGLIGSPCYWPTWPLICSSNAHNWRHTILRSPSVRLRPALDRQAATAFPARKPQHPGSPLIQPDTFSRFSWVTFSSKSARISGSRGLISSCDSGMFGFLKDWIRRMPDCLAGYTEPVVESA